MYISSITLRPIMTQDVQIAARFVTEHAQYNMQQKQNLQAKKQWKMD